MLKKKNNKNPSTDIDTDLSSEIKKADEYEKIKKDEKALENILGLINGIIEDHKNESQKKKHKQEKKNSKPKQEIKDNEKQQEKQKPKQQEEFKEKQVKQKPKHKEYKICECADKVEANCDPCNAPLAENALNVVLIDLPKEIRFVLPPKFNGSNISQQALNESLTTTILTAITVFQNKNYIDKTIKTTLNGFGISDIARTEKLNYFIKLPSELCNEVKIEWPLRCIIPELISKMKDTIKDGVYINEPNNNIWMDNKLPLDINICNENDKDKCKNEEDCMNNPFNNANTGLVNISINLNIDTQGNIVKNFAVIPQVQSVLRSNKNCGKGDNSNKTIVVDFNFYFLIVNGVLTNGFVLLSNGDSEYIVLTINPNAISTEFGLKPNNFVLGIPVISTGNVNQEVNGISTTLNSVIGTLPITISGTVTNDGEEDSFITFEPTVSIGTPNLPADIILPDIEINPLPIGITPGIQAADPAIFGPESQVQIGVPIRFIGGPGQVVEDDGSTLIDNGFRITLPSNNVGVTVTDFSTVVPPNGSYLVTPTTINAPIFSSVTTDVTTIGNIPVFTPGILLSFYESCDKEFFVMVNETDFNL